MQSRPLRLSLSVLMLTLSVLMLASVLGIDERRDTGLREARGSVAQSLALQLSSMTVMGQSSSIGESLRLFVEGNDDVVAASVNQPNGYTLAAIGPSAELTRVVDKSTITHIRVPVYKGDSHWGNVDVVFTPLNQIGSSLLWYSFIAICCFLAFLLFFKRALVQLDPSRAVPGRVDSAFNLFNEGVVILDDQLRIVMANSAAGELVNKSSDDLLGQSLDTWPWVKEGDWQAPWATTLHSGLDIVDKAMRLTLSDGTEGVYVISSSSVGNEQEKRGVLVTFDDMTEFERQNKELENKESSLRKLNDSLTSKNQELEVLATRDPLSGLYNRRVLMENLEREYQRAERESQPLSVVMADIDFFKKINDTFGHGVGDDVIKAVANQMALLSREYDTVGRYGGEEFMVVLPGRAAEEAKEIAERIRLAVTELPEKANLPVGELSASFGIAELTEDTESETVFIDHADQALYSAKQQGRNRVQIFSKDLPRQPKAEESQAVATPTKSSAPSAKNTVSAEVSEEALARIKQLEALVRQRTSDLKKLKEHDALTGVPMRTIFLQRADFELKRCARANKSVGVMSFEIRDLVRLQATFGHAASEALVVEFVARLHEGLRDTDIVTDLTEEHSLSRITGNEYGVLLSDMHSADNAMPVITRLRRMLSKPFLVDGEKVYVGTNIGIAVYPQSGETPEALLECASSERVKAAQSPDKVSHSFASKQMDNQSHTYIRVESDLYDAIHKNELEVFYQPKFDLSQQTVVGMEALVRWRNADGGFNSPMDFIPVAEANGLINELYDFVLAESLRQIKTWEHIGFQNLTVAVNISAVQLRDPNLVAKTMGALQRANVDPSMLEIELTETAIIDNRERANQTLHELRSSGVKVSMDDFGIGYTSLALLADLPIDTVKIDRSFIVAMDQSERSRAIIESIIMMAQSLSLTVVGEGIETNSQLTTLDALGCHLIQGFLISKPLPKEELVTFLVQHQTQKSRRSA